MRSLWILVPVVLFAFGPARAIARQQDSIAPVPPAQQPDKTQQPVAPAEPVSPATIDAPRKDAEKKTDSTPVDGSAPAQSKNPDQSSTSGTDKPAQTNPFAPQAAHPKVKSDNPFPTDDSPTAPLPRMESLPPADEPKPGEAGWSSSLDHADSALSDSISQGGQAPPPITELDMEIRAKEDIKIARYYASIGSWKGALGRYQSAVQNAKDDEDAVCGLAEAERHLGFSNEAILHYTECLHLDPTGPYSRSAQKALKSLAAHR
jgi:cytoskeletal protein RodZ